MIVSFFASSDIFSSWQQKTLDNSPKPPNQTYTVIIYSACLPKFHLKAISSSFFFLQIQILDFNKKSLMSFEPHLTVNQSSICCSVSVLSCRSVTTEPITICWWRPWHVVESFWMSCCCCYSRGQDWTFRHNLEFHLMV